MSETAPPYGTTGATTATGATALALLTASRMRAFRKCQQLHYLRYVEGWQPIRSSEALRIGTLVHLGLEHWWTAAGDPDVPHSGLSEALAAVAGRAYDAYEQVLVEELLAGYDARWAADRAAYETIGAELEYRAPLLNPETWKPSRTWQLAGKVDALARRRADGRVLVVEHKTTSESIADDSDHYWSTLSLDHQISGYVIGAEALGHSVDEVLYDVIRKPGQRRLEATPLDKRKFKADGSLYANQREHDETPEEYRARIREAIAAEPGRYYQRRSVPRSDSQIRDFMFDARMQGQAMRESERLRRAPKNPDACHQFGTCAFWQVCSTGSSPESFPHDYQRSENPNPELAAAPQGSQQQEV